MNRTFIALGAFLAFLAVAAGAFGAHGLKDKVSPDMLTVFETAARYQMYHALALVLIGFVTEKFPGRLITVAGWLFIVGIAIFSGSLYALVLSGQRWLGAITPIGGVAFMAGWICFGIAALRSRA
ncbi:MAG: DUF423 domain-containing protein [Candidatus Sumerlaeaceae bacterium]|nr:DUF423 domain-containing protein [Candidatus Sumerlaeaceae bacterium]